MLCFYHRNVIVYDVNGRKVNIMTEFAFGFACGVATAFAIATIGLSAIISLAIWRASKDGDPR